MGFWSSIGSTFSSAASWVGNAISSAADWAGRALGTVVEKGGSAVGSALSGVASFMGSLFQTAKPDDPDLRDWGDRAMQADAQKIFPSEFKNFDAYLDRLRSFELDPQKSRESNDFAKTLKGLEVTGKAIEVKWDMPEGSMASVYLLGAADPEFATSERFVNLLKSGMNVKDIAAYFEGDLAGAERLQVENDLVQQDSATHVYKDEKTSRAELRERAESIQAKLRDLQA